MRVENNFGRNETRTIFLEVQIKSIPFFFTCLWQEHFEIKLKLIKKNSVGRLIDLIGMTS